jgi:hypothetical protein
MRIIPTTLLAGVASVALVGSVAAHTLTVRLPDGTIEQINYAGNVEPQVSFVPATIAAEPDMGFGPNSPFALMQQISTEMDRETAAMLQQMRQLQAAAFQPMPGIGQPLSVDMTNLPRGVESYSFVSTLSPGGACSESIQITSTGPGQKPQVVTHRSGNCGTMGASAPTKVAAPDETSATIPAQPRVQTDQASAVGNPAYRGMLHTVSW